MGTAVAAAFGLEYLNKTLRNEDDIEEQDRTAGFSHNPVLW